MILPIVRKLSVGTYGKCSGNGGLIGLQRTERNHPPGVVNPPKRRNFLTFGALALALLAGCRDTSGAQCVEQVDPLAEEVAAVVEAHQGCTADADCTLLEPDLPCADLCARAVSDPEAVSAALETVAGQCPDCFLKADCVEAAPYCSLADGPAVEGTCDTCRGDTAVVGDGAVAGDGCWEPPEHRCSDVDASAAPVLACPPAGVSGDCCEYDRGCLPCGWIDCDATPDDPRCLLATDGGTGRCPVVPYGTFCLDVERFGG